METKKDPKVNLESRRTTFILAGLVVTLAVLFIGLEWSSTQRSHNGALVRNSDDFIDREIPITIQSQMTPPPPPPPAPEVITEFAEVDNDIEIEEMDMQSSEDDDDVPINLVQMEGEPSDIEECGEQDNYFVVVENQPEFPGGESALMKYLNKNIRYPAFAQENGIQGRVTVSFIVERDGSIASIEVMRSPAEELSKESIRVVQSMPKWKPGRQRGKAVRVKYVLPITFRLS